MFPFKSCLELCQLTKLEIQSGAYTSQGTCSVKENMFSNSNAKSQLCRNQRHNSLRILYTAFYLHFSIIQYFGITYLLQFYCSARYSLIAQIRAEINPIGVSRKRYCTKPSTRYDIKKLPVDFSPQSEYLLEKNATTIIATKSPGIPNPVLIENIYFERYSSIIPFLQMMNERKPFRNTYDNLLIKC